MKLTNRNVEAQKPAPPPYEKRDDDIKGFLVRIQPTGKKTYYISYNNVEGKRQRYRIGTHGTITAAQAREVAEKQAGKVALEIDVQRAKRDAVAQVEINKSKTLKTFLSEKYEPWAKTERKAGVSTVKMLNAQFQNFMDTPLDAIGLWDIQKWRTERLKSGTKPATVNRNIVALKALLSKAIEWQIISIHPLAGLKPLKIDSGCKTRYLSPREEEALRLALDEREAKMADARQSHNKWLQEREHKLLPEISEDKFADHLKPMVLLSINTGMRRGELFALRWENISFSKGHITIAGETAKSGRTRHIPLNSEAMGVLKKWRSSLDASGLVFPSKDGDLRNNANKSWRNLLGDAKIKNFRWHDMRHHFASKLVMASVDLNTVRELLGHASMDMTLRYAHLAPEFKKEAVERLVAQL